MAKDNIVYVYDKKKNLLATFRGDTEGLSEDAMQGNMVAPTLKTVQNGESTLSYQMLANSEKFQQIKDPENLYRVNDRWYTALNESAYVYSGQDGVRVCNVVLTEIWSLLSRQFVQAYNCGIYCYAKATFVGYTPDGAEFTIKSGDCSNPGNSISTAAAWAQVKLWKPKNDKGTNLIYSILQSEGYKPTNWDKAPTSVIFKSFTVSGDTARLVIQSRSSSGTGKVYPYSSSNQYKIESQPYPSSVSAVTINYTTVRETDKGKEYTTSEKDVPYSYNASTGFVTVNYTPASSEKINAVGISYYENNLGDIKVRATCTFAYGAEAVDEHTFVILPKSNSKYKLTIDGVVYNDSDVKDSRGVVMPRGSGGYAMWAALRNSGWTLGICDVLAKGFDPSIDYGCFNIESDMKDVLYIVEYIQQLYGGILDWDSDKKVLNYRAENSTDYQAYNDGFNTWTGYEFREGKNLLEVPEVTVDNKLITRGFLLGYGNLNVKNVNGGKTYIEDFSYTDAVYEGYLEQPLIYDTRDEGGQKQLLYWGQKELHKKSRPRKTIALSVTDLRTTPEHSYEVFDINDIVQVRYQDEVGDKLIVEQQRVVEWEYNVFAMWDSTVVLGDKTSNLVELFKLVYNNTLDIPGSNASGNISSSKVNMGAGFGTGNGWGDEFYYGDENSLQHYIQLIAQTTTENSDAIAGLVLDTSAIHSQVDLFAMYQKQTDTLLTESYAGLQLYADEKSAQAVLSAQNYTDKISQDLAGNINQKITQSEATLRLYADDKKAEAIQSAVYQSQQYVNGELKSYTTTSAMNSAIATERDARVAMEARFNNKLTGYATTASVTAVANDVSAQARMIAQLDNEIDGKASMAYVETYVDESTSKISLEVKNGLAQSGLRIDQNQITIDSYKFYCNSATAEIENLYISSRGSLDINSNATFSYGPWKIKRMSYSIPNSGTIYYLGVSSG